MDLCSSMNGLKLKHTVLITACLHLPTFVADIWQYARRMGMADLCNALTVIGQSSKNVGLRFSNMSPTNAVFGIANSLASNRQLKVFYGLNSVWHVATGVGVEYTTALGHNFFLIPIHLCKGLSPGRNLYRDGGYVDRPISTNPHRGSSSSPSIHEKKSSHHCWYRCQCVFNKHLSQIIHKHRS